ncbi:MAG: hypothetical protein GQ547_02015 [Methylophaga sp.]|nr:hypothetical protein [Methylophaga sp.]
MTKLLRCSLIIGCLLIAPNLVAAQVLIVHPANNTTELSRNTLRAIFAMRTPQWPDGSPLQVFVLDDSDSTHTSFCKHILGMFPYQLRRIWDRQVFSGTGTAPITVKTEQEMLERVSTTKGAIGYVLPEKVDDSVKTLGELL